jgi:hypothetical protein
MFVVIQSIDTSIDLFEIEISIVISGYNRWFRLKMDNRCDLLSWILQIFSWFVIQEFEYRAYWIEFMNKMQE